MSAFLWALLASLAWGVAPLLEKVGLRDSPPMIGLFARTVGVLAGMVLFGLWWSPWRAMGQLTVRSFLLLAAGGLLASFLGQMAFYQALKLGHVSQVTPIAGTYPLIAAVLGWTLLREPFTTPRLLGAVFVVVGALLLRH